ncbi:unnamed protein product [Staurois parvus]|uniref:Uncharacterized protein n=1 Tax=Staurois parvus TaxID=386267 RepID=A0ABN9DM32_9NEOB|nr:unnamed protein product [Staurois parvus]
MSFTLVVSGKNGSYSGVQWEEYPLHWWSGLKMHFASVARGKEWFLHVWSLGKMVLMLVVSGKMLPLQIAKKNNWCP